MGLTHSLKSQKLVIVPFLMDVLAKAFPFLLFFLLAYYLDPEQVAYIGLFDSARKFFFIPLSMSLPIYLGSQFYKSSERQAFQMLFEIVCFSMALFAVVTGIFLLSTESLSDWFTLAPWFVFLAILAALIETVHANFVVFLQSSEKLLAFARVTFLFPFLIFTLSLIDFFLLDHQWEVRAYGIVAGGLLFLLFYLSRFVSKASQLKAFDLENLNRYLGFGLFLLPQAILLWTFISADKVFVAGYMDLEELGIYSVMAQISLITYHFCDTLNTSLKPKLFKTLSINSKSNSSTKVSVFFLSASLVVSLVNALLGHLLLSLFFAETYQVHVNLIYFLCPAMSLLYFTSYLFNFFYHAEKTLWVCLLSLAFTGGHYLVMTTLIPDQGVQGAAYGMLISSSCMAVLTLIATRLLLNQVPSPQS